MSKQNKVRGKSITRQLRDETEPFLSTKSFCTQKNYRKWLDAYIKYCREFHNCKSHDECFMHIQDYSDYLQEQGYPATTIHNYLAAVCSFYGVPMNLITKPIRHTAEYTKSRSDNGKTIRADNNPDNPRYERTISFQRVVGIRAAELAKLEGRDLVTDESGHLSVFVKNGKGGKDSLQRILPENEEFIESYFEGVGEKEKVFQPIELSNSIDYHHIRAENAKRCYDYYLNRINTEKGYAENWQMKFVCIGNCTAQRNFLTAQLSINPLTINSSAAHTKSEARTKIWQLNMVYLLLTTILHWLPFQFFTWLIGEITSPCSHIFYRTKSNADGLTADIE